MVLSQMMFMVLGAMVRGMVLRNFRFESDQVRRRQAQMKSTNTRLQDMLATDPGARNASEDEAGACYTSQVTMGEIVFQSSAGTMHF